MLIIPFLNPSESLFLDAYSYQLQEIAAVERMLRLVPVSVETSRLKRDSENRFGVRYLIPIQDVPRLEKQLKVRFQKEGSATVMVVGWLGTGYRCREISPYESAKGCLNMSAIDQADAMVKCALLAKHNSWFGGEAKRGQCPGSVSDVFRQLFRPSR